MLTYLAVFGVGAICGAIILVSFSAITYDERTKGQSRGTNVPTQPTVPKMPEMQERKERSEDDT